METWDEMTARHEKEIEKFQTACPHKHQKIHTYVHGYMMHGGSTEDFCLDCHKILAYYRIPYKMVGKPPYFSTAPSGPEERIEADKLDEWLRSHPVLE
jgi:hypothetical protein